MPSPDLQRGEAELAGVAEVHDAAGEADGLAGRGVGLEVRAAVADRGDRGRSTGTATG